MELGRPKNDSTLDGRRLLLKSAAAIPVSLIAPALHQKLSHNTPRIVFGGRTSS